MIDPAVPIPKHFDNSPVAQILEEVYPHISKLSFQGCQIRDVRLDGFKAVIHVEPRLGLEYEALGEDGFGRVTKGCVQIVWRVYCPLEGSIDQVHR